MILSLVFSVLLTPNFLQAQDPNDEIPSDEAVISSGEKLFLGNCKVCHSINEKVIGPALRDIHKRKDVTWISDFIKNSQKVINSGDSYAVKLYNEYNKTEMTSFDFEDDEILSIIAYLKAESSKEIVTATEITSDDTTDTNVQGQPSQFMNVLLIVLFVVLVLILIVLVLIISLLKNYLAQKEDLSDDDKQILNQSIDLGALVKSNAFLAIVAFVFTAIVLKSVIDGLFTVGVQQGYQPTQPIAFSHKVHAGDFKIDCNYCHTGVRKSKNANIPSPNICMNCHSSILPESPEIKKLYTAVKTKATIARKALLLTNAPRSILFQNFHHV